MSKWQELDIESKITQILRDVPDSTPEHPLGRPYLTASVDENFIDPKVRPEHRYGILGGSGH